MNRVLRHRQQKKCDLNLIAPELSQGRSAAERAVRVAGARPRWIATRQLHHCVDRRATWHLARSRARRRTLATLHPALPALPRWQCRPSLRWLTGSACHAPPAPRCRGRTAACASGADGRTSTAQVRRLHLCTLARCMVRTAAPAGHQRHGHPATQCQLGTSISDRVRITPQALQLSEAHGCVPRSCSDPPRL